MTAASGSGIVRDSRNATNMSAVSGSEIMRDTRSASAMSSQYSLGSQAAASQAAAAQGWQAHKKPGERHIAWGMDAMNVDVKVADAALRGL